MGTNIATAATSSALIPAAVQAAGGKEYTEDEVRQLVAALEEPFDPREIKWRVTNTTRTKNADRCSILGSACVHGPAERHLHRARLDP
jgi:hypothetical protein